MAVSYKAMVFVAALLCLTIYFLLAKTNLLALTGYQHQSLTPYPRLIDVYQNESIIKVNLTFHDDATRDSYFAQKSVRAMMKEKITLVGKALEQTYKRLAATPATSSNITRAVLVFLPSGKPGYEKEFRSFYLSVALVRGNQHAHVKTDLIVFTPPSNLKVLVDHGCSTEVRKSFSDDEMCLALPHVPLKDRPQEGFGDPLVPYANYIDSMLVLAEFEHGQVYDYLLRSDMDCFLTPGFSTWIPPQPWQLIVGRGGYGSQNANAHLSWVSGQLKLTQSHMESLGSTWFGSSALMVGASKLTVEVMRWMTTQEFSEYERCCNGVDGWPHWHWPVLLLYGGHVALNHLGPGGIVKSDSGGVELDYQSTLTDTMSDNVKHIHCWHTDKMFSKFAFQSGKYNDLDLTSYLGMKSGRDYSTVIAVSSSRLSVKEIADIFPNRTAISQKLWLRIKP